MVVAAGHLHALKIWNLDRLFAEVVARIWQMAAKLPTLIPSKAKDVSSICRHNTMILSTPNGADGFSLQVKDKSGNILVLLYSAYSQLTIVVSAS